MGWILLFVGLAFVGGIVFDWAVLRPWVEKRKS